MDLSLISQCSALIGLIIIFIYGSYCYRKSEREMKKLENKLFAEPKKSTNQSKDLKITYIVLGIALIVLFGYGAYLNHKNEEEFSKKDIF